MAFLPFAVSGVGLGGIYALCGVGIVILYRASGTLNLALGAVGAVSAYITWTALQVGLPAPASWICGIAVATLLSLGYGVFVSPRLSHREPGVRSIATLGLALGILGAIALVWGVGIPRRLILPTDGSYLSIFGTRLNYTRVAALAVAAVGVVGTNLLLWRTRIGLAMRALASDRNISSLVGVRIARVDAVAWTLSGIFAGVAGIFLADIVRLEAGYLMAMVIPAIAAATIGGFRSLPLAFVGGLIAGLCEATLTAVPLIGDYRSAAPYVLALAAIALTSRTASTQE